MLHKRRHSRARIYSNLRSGVEELKDGFDLELPSDGVGDESGISTVSKAFSKKLIKSFSILFHVNLSKITL